jgi:integrase/recombinase XerD
MSASHLQRTAEATPAEIGEAELIEAFADFIQVDIASGDASADTIRTYLSQLQQYLDWSRQRNLHPAYASRRTIKEYRRWMVEEKAYKPATIALKLATVRRFYEAAADRGLIGANPAVGVKAPRERRDPAERITFLEEEEVRQLLDAIADDGSLRAKRDRALIEIMALEGPRTVEMHRADMADIVRQGNNFGIRVTGKRSIRIVPLTPRLAESLQAYLQVRRTAEATLAPTSPLFIAVGNRAGGERLSRSGIRRIINKYLIQCQLKYAPGRTLSAHSLRHTAGTLALRAGADLRQVQDLLGHADPRTTAIYAHVGDRWENNPALKLDF